MSIRSILGKGAIVVALSVMIVASLLFAPQRTAHAASGLVFRETVDGVSYLWTQQTNGYYNRGTNRFDTGRWNVAIFSGGGRPTGIGQIEVGVNEFTSGTGHHGFAIDTTSTITGDNGGPLWAHELLGSEHPSLPDRVSHESPWGFGDVKSPHAAIIEGVAHGHFHRDVTNNLARETQMLTNMNHMIGLQDQAYSTLENISNARPHAVTGVTPNVLPIALYLLAAAGATLLVGGSVVNQVCNANHCGRHSKTWAMVGGIVAALGTLITIVSGVSITGAIIEGRAAAAAAAQGIRAVAQAARDVELGSVYASARSSFSEAGDIQAAFAVPAIN